MVLKTKQSPLQVQVTVNGQQIDQIGKNILKSLRDVGFCACIETNLKT